MSSLNKVMIIGRLGADPEVRYTQSNTAVASLSIATSNKYKDKNGELQEQTEWHRAVAWGRTAEICQQYLKKGAQVYIEGPLKTRDWEDKEGVKRYTTEITVLQLTMLGSSGNSGDGTPHPAQNGSGKQGHIRQTVVLDEDFSDLDDDLPF